MVKTDIIFRADASPTIGMGHFIRSLALAEMLNAHFNCIFSTRNPTEYQISEIEKVCHSRIDLPNDDSHFDQFLNYLKGNEIIVLDNYFFSTAYQNKIKHKGCKLVCIDDMQDKHYFADIVINHTPVDKSLFSVEPYTKLLIGFDYALLRKEFRKSNSLHNTEKLYSCLVIIGGCDPLKITEKILKSLIKKHLEKPIVVLNYEIDNKNVICKKNISAQEISTLMNNSEFGIFPASTISIEACIKQFPFICGYFIDNQEKLYSVIENQKLALCSGNFNILNDEIFSYFIDNILCESVRNNIISNQKKHFDSNIQNRFIKIFLELQNEN